MRQLPLSQQTRKQEMNTIYHIAKNNGCPLHTITQLSYRITNKKPTLHKTTHMKKSPKWTTFRYHSPLLQKVTNTFKHTNLGIAYRATNTLQQLLRTSNGDTDKYTVSGIYVGGPKRNWNFVIKNCVFILRCYKFNLLQSTVHLMQCTGLNVFSTF
jgi:hypothetical protein